MPRPDRTQELTETVHRYLAAVANGSVDDLVAFYADDATLEDPVGGEVHIGKAAIAGFYSAIIGTERETELVTLRVSGNEAAFHFRLIVAAGDNKMQIEPIETIVFNSEGKVTAMKAYWSAADVKRL
ncbi:steroid delta-isomerase [Mycobacterium intermedium]|uniref:Steroid delta-isomerase n=1 Tax=Mycobacterium intermedium TaxID=28445 RepID=A0A1E3S676_MYCIE|nr:nuclear transport factor 2 family protein [Mycobacterium intermedium]MCV6966782.1 nuclear transport factor 2 family protein [Mycobacterium intermedium]ODQ97152.1 steroid delta-isomerase [Mycobacterium intermedium]OPE46942.1 steroid delta-isomerase [Mycobacterium intermedium]ORA95417.1 steroid delta-isomerase [Mycobacterium intermedium]